MHDRPAPPHVFAFLAALLGLVLLAHPITAQDRRGFYSVSDIEVDETADDAVTARSRALDQGQREGMRRLLERLTGPELRGRLPDVGALPIEQYVRSFEIEREELTPTRYMARLTVHYNDVAVQRLLDERALPQVQAPSEQILILPVLVAGDGVRLFEDPNPWRDAWSRADLSRSLIQFVLPLGDLQDVTTIDGEMAVRGDRQALRRLADRYAADEVVIARLRPTEADDAILLRLDLLRAGERAETLAEDELRGAPGAPLEEVLADGVRRMVVALEDVWKGTQMLDLADTESLVVELVLADLGAWVQMNDTLSALPEVRRTTVDAFARQRARVRLDYVGELDQLQSALAQRGLSLSRDGETWRLQASGAGPN